ncbi:chromosomal replication initiator protein DnaA [Azonexus fungiphilus]|jgi:chromosomal replication initiator protein|uniref:Chromosomal replication initiator protein DnaA n=1 Tax=Azonexus fungiphilus TaxID=146940 RepID=A0A495VQD7_9RHOO|nr:chromosomal replication initiator protein DnaA [Azonexus fungiphilus]NHC06722.1 chromosomal replication initiator protein DnaA [Azonexus fungiphilus]RKT51150.1 chromosomal replication initiator protein DnaA [Azonexus fungiphilus]
MTGFWESCLQRFEQELPAQQFNTWIKPLRLEGENTALEDGLRLIAPNGFILKWVRDRYLGRIEDYGRTFFAAPVSIALVIGSGKPAAPARSESAAPSASPAAAESKPAAAPAAAKPRAKTASVYDKSRLFSNFTFDNLVVGKANDLARAAALQVAGNPGGAYNPLFIYGGAGLGKTHLIHAIGNHIVAENPDKVVRYVHAEDYYSDVVRAYQQKSFDTFKRTYRSLDVLLLDDVQFFNGKNRSQEEFFFLFNALIEARKQIIITCDTYPKDINGLDDRLVTRFDWGLTVQIEPPELEMRVAILQKKAEAEGIRLDDEVAFFIAKHLRSNVRELEGALKKVLAYSSFHGRVIALDLAKEALKDLIGSVRNVGIDNIQKTVADYYKIKVAEFFSKKRTRAIARPRQVAMWLCREVTSHSFPEIGDAFGGRDHTTVIHAVKTIDSLRAKDSELNHDLHVLLQVLKG